MRLTKQERKAQAVLPLPIEFQPEPMSFCADQPKWERHAILRNWLQHSDSKKALAYRESLEASRRYWAMFTPEMVASAWKKHEAEQYQRKIEAGLVVDCPPSDAVAFWYDTRFGIDRSRAMRLGRWVNQVQLDGLLKRGMKSEFIVSVTAFRLTPIAADAAISEQSDDDGKSRRPAEHDG